MKWANRSLVVALAGAVTLAAATPTFARSWRPWAAAGAGFAAGTMIGAAAANSRAYYAPGYAGGYYEPGYDAYAYAPPAVAYEGVPTVTYQSQYLDPKSSCAVAGNYGRLDYSSC